MHTDLNTTTPINKEVWDQLDFDNKSLFYLNDQDEIILLSTQRKGEKNLGKFDFGGFELERRKLSENFDKLQEQFNEFEKLWLEQEDKLKARYKLRSLAAWYRRTDFMGDTNPIESTLLDRKAYLENLYHQNESIMLRLVEEAEQLQNSEDWHNTTNKYKQLLEEWKTGPELMRNVHDSFWNRINTAKDFFFDKKRHYYEELEKEQMVNLDLKMELCDKAESLSESEDWRATSQAFQDLMEKWKSIGLLPSQEKNNELWERFSKAKDHFYNRKSEHTSAIKEEQEENYRLKLELLEKVEALSTATQWKTTAQEMEVLNKAWNKIGKVPKAYNDEIWQRWKSARDFFFDAKRAHAKEFKAALEENYERKKVITERAEHLSNSHDWRNATNELAELMTEWRTIGPVPREYGDDLWHRFNQARKLFFKRKDEDRDKRINQYKKKEAGRIKQTESFLKTLYAEQEEEKTKLEEFKEAISNIDGAGKKDQELKEHLSNLIEKIELALPKKADKIAEIEAQLQKLIEKSND